MKIVEINHNEKTLHATTLEGVKSACETLNAEEKFTESVIKEFSDFLVDPIAGSKMLIGGSTNFKMFSDDNIRLEAFEVFISTYFRELEGTYSEDSHKLDIASTFSRMSVAIFKGSFNKDSQAIKNACKVLKIKHTYKAIRDYLTAEEK